jgi:iron complex outermembrane receptor protein
MGQEPYDGSDAFRNRSFGVRSKMLFTPDTKTQVVASIDYTTSTYDEGVAMRPVQGALFPNGQTFQGYYNINENTRSQVHSQQLGASLKISRDLSFGKLVSITAFRHSYANILADEDQSADNSQTFTYRDGGKTWSQELRLTADPTRHVHLIGGLFYFSNDAGLDPFQVTGTAVSPLFSVVEGFHQLTRSYSAFGQATFDLPAGFHLTVEGATPETSWISAYEDLHATETGSPTRVDAQQGHVTDGSPSVKVALQKDIAANANVYVNYSTGFRGATFNSISVVPQAVQPEKLYNVSGGVKGEFFDRRVRLAIEGFHYTYNNLQVSTIVLAGNLHAHPRSCRMPPRLRIMASTSICRPSRPTTSWCRRDLRPCMPASAASPTLPSRFRSRAVATRR